MDSYAIIKRPVITEKATIQKDTENKLTFEVDKRSNRVEIRRAIEKLFNVNVKKVRTSRVQGKKKRRGQIIGQRRSWKKAIVTLGPGESIEFIEGV